MIRPTEPQLVELLQATDKFIGVTSPRWMFDNMNFARAIRCELAELSKVMGWALRPTEPHAHPNYTAARLTVFVVLQHTFAMALISAQGRYINAAHEIAVNLQFPETEVMTVANKSFTLAGMTLHDSIDILSMFASLGYTFPALLERIMVGCGVSWDDMFLAFVGRSLNQSTLDLDIPKEPA
jgi:hypothetical protein